MATKSKKKSKIKRIYMNAFFNVIALIAVIVMLVFCIYLFRLDMLPFKYLSILYLVIGFIYLILLGLTLPRRIKYRIKTICLVLFVLFSLTFAFGIKYVDKTIEFMDVINNELSQKEEYHVSVLKNSIIESGSELNNKKVGLYTMSDETKDKIMEIINKELSYEFVSYTDVILMFEDLSEKKIDAVIVNSSLETLLETDLDYLNLELKNVYSLMVPISEESDIVKIVDVTNTPFNVYIAGGDAYGSINKVTNTDVNMIVSVDPVKRKILLTSIPRDYYVLLPSKGDDAYDKLTHAGYYGIGESVKAVEKLLDIEINYYAKVNFSTIEGIIDAIGGVDVYVEKGFTTSNGVYTFKKGINHMNGAKALRFARERKVFSSGDVQRVKNQQKVFSAILSKVTSSTALITGYSDILDSVKKNFSTNLDTKSINRLVKMQLNDMRGWSIESQNLVGTGASKKTFTFPKMNLYVMERNEESVTNASTKIKEFFEINMNAIH